MDFLSRELIGGLSLIVALVAVFAGSDFRFTPLVVLMFALAVVWMAVVMIHRLLRRRRGKKAWLPVLVKELQTGFVLRDKARLARNGQQLFDASQAFIDWGLRVNALIRENAPHYYLDLPDTAPWALQGKERVLEIMDERLRAHSLLLKHLERHEE